MAGVLQFRSRSRHLPSVVLRPSMMFAIALILAFAKLAKGAGLFTFVGMGLGHWGQINLFCCCRRCFFF